jgi:hypothetical protein
MRRRRAMGMGVAVVVMGVAMVMTGVVGMGVRHEEMLHYNITGVHAPLPVMPREGGASSTPRILGSITGVSGILDRPPQCAIAHKADDDN